jgi:competence protein ComEC
VFVAEIAALSMIAQAATLPLSAYVFNRLPVTALPANVLILPVQPMLMAAGAVTAVAGLVSPALATATSWLVWPLAAYTIRVVELFASLPGASLALPPISGGWVVLGYAAAAGLFVTAKQTKARAAAASLLRVGGPAWLVVLGSLATLAWRTATERPDGRLHVTAFPGGEVLIETPAGRFVAVSAGPTPIGLGESLDRRLPVTHPALDWLILTDPESSVSATLQALGRHRPDSVLLIDSGNEREAGLLAHNFDAVPGMALDLGNGAQLEVVQLGPAGTIIGITYGQAAILLMENVISSTGGSVPSSESTAVVLLGDGRRVARALAGRWPGHGPLVVVAAPLPGEPFVPPGQTPEGARSILATPFDGWVRLSTDGVRFEVRVERER